jgi:hypothetical protein
MSLAVAPDASQWARTAPHSAVSNFIRASQTKQFGQALKSFLARSLLEQVAKPCCLILHDETECDGTSRGRLILLNDHSRDHITVKERANLRNKYSWRGDGRGLGEARGGETRGGNCKGRTTISSLRHLSFFGIVKMFPNLAVTPFGPPHKVLTLILLIRGWFEPQGRVTVQITVLWKERYRVQVMHWGRRCKCSCDCASGRTQ